MKKNIFRDLGILLITYLTLVILLFNVFCILKINNLVLIEILSVIIPIMFYGCRKFKKEKIKIILLYLLIILSLPFVYSTFFDMSCDGNSYHKTAIGYIENGWNPIYETAKEFYEKNDNVPAIDAKTSLWIEHYPNGNWIISGVMYKMTGSVESGKCTLLILSIALCLLVYDLLSKIMNKKMSLLISFLACYSPIVICQIFTYYIDGTLGVCLLLELIFLIKLTKDKKDKLSWWGLLSTIILASGLKFTGFAFSSIFVFIFYIKELYKYIKEKNYKELSNMTLYFITLYILFLIIGGGLTYINNFISHGNPFYPLAGEGKVDIITTMQPKSFENKSSIEKNIISLFSKTDNITYVSGYEPTLKLPFLVYRNEIVNTAAPDTRISGMGPLFTYSLILSILSLIWALKVLYKKDKDKFKLITYSLLTIVISIICLSERWWARYVPQMYYITIIALLSLSLAYKYIKYKKTFKIVFALLLMAIFTNSSIYGYYRIKELNNFGTLRLDLVELSKQENVELKLSIDDYWGVCFNLKDYKIKYKIVDNIPLDEIEYKFGGKIMVRK